MTLELCGSIFNFFYILGNNKNGIDNWRDFNMNTDMSHLTSAEMGKLWATYSGNTMGKCVISHFLRHVEDPGIKNILKNSMKLCDTYIKEIKIIFNKEDFPVPIGFTDEDVNLEAPRLFNDDFYLYYLQYTGKAGLSIYSAAISIVTRKDIRDLFVKCLHGTVKLLTDVDDLLREKGLLMNAPLMPSPKSVNYADKSFLNGYLGDIRSLHGLEIAHLYDNINNDVTSKALVVAFQQVAQSKKVKKFLERGATINKKHIESLSKKLHDDNLPSPSLLDQHITSSTIPPFSDKLMVFHKIDMFSMKIRTYANGASLNGRRDIGALYAKCIFDVTVYVEEGASIMIDQGWMEQPPEAIDRQTLANKE